MALKVGELFASFNLDTSGIAGAVSNAEKQMSNLGKGMMIAGAGMTAAVTMPLANAAKAVYEAGSSFDAQMSKVFAIAGKSVTGSAEAMDALRTKALEMGSTTQFTATEAGEAMEYMAMAGWKTDQMLAAIEPLMNLAAAAGEELGTTSDIVTDAMTAFGLSAEGTTKVIKDGLGFEVNNVAHFADVLAAVSSNANTNVSMLGESFKYVAPIAGSMGFSVEDTAMALGIMANSGIKASQAGTSLRRIMTSLNGDIEIEGKNLGKVAIRTTNADGSMRSFAEILTDCRKAFAGLTESEKASAAKALVGQNAMSGFLALMNASEEDVKSLTGAIDDCTGAAEEMADTMLDNAKGDVTLFKSALEGLEITLWKLAEGGFRKTVQQATKLVDAFRNADVVTQMGTVKMAALAAAIGPALTGMGGLVTLLPKIPRLLMALTGPAGLLALGFVALGAAAMDNDNTIGKTFVKAMKKAGDSMRQLGARVKAQLPQLEKNMQNFLGSISAGIQEGLPGITQGFTDIMTTGITALSDNMPLIGETAGTIVTTIATSLSGSLKEIIPAIAKLAANIAVAIILNIPKLISAGIILFQGILQGLEQVNWTELGTKIHDAVKDALTEIKTNLFTLIFGEDAVPPEGELGEWGQFGAMLVEHIKSGITKASNAGKNLLGGLFLGSDYDPDDSWGTVATKIWGKITSSMGTILAAAPDLLKGMVLREDYTPDATWGDVATKIWKVIGDKFTELRGKAKELLGKLALGSDYTADVSWQKIASAIWDRIKLKFGDLKEKTKELIGNLVLGEDYSADDSWGKIGSALWGKISDKLTELKDTAKNFFGKLVLGDDYTADTSWTTVGSEIWSKVQSGITAGKEMVTAVLEKIGSIEIDASQITTLVTNASEFVSGLVGKMLSGKIQWRAKIVGIASQIVEKLAHFDWSSMGVSLGRAAGELVSSIAEAIPHAIDAAGNLVDAGLTLAGSLVDTIVGAFDAFTGSTDLNISGIVTSMVNNITKLIPKAFELGGKLLSAGAHIAQSIFTSIADALKDVNASGIAETLGTAATDLLKKLLNSAAGLKDNPEVIAFMENLGSAIVDGLGSLGSIVGDFAGKLLGFLFSKEGLMSIYNAGTTILDLLVQGMMAGVEGMLNFFGNMLDNLLINLGLIDPEARDAAKESGQRLAAAMATGMSSELASGMKGQTLLTLMDYFLSQGGQGAQYSGEHIVDETLNSLLNAIFGDAAKAAGDNAEAFRAQIYEGLITQKTLDWDLWRSLLGIDYKNGSDELFDAIEAALEGWESAEAYLKSRISLEDLLPEDLNFWDAVLKAVKEGDTTELMNLMTTQGVALFGEAADATAEAAAAAEEAAERAMESLYGSAEEAAKAGTADVISAAEESANALAKQGMTQALLDGVGPVEGAALTVSDAAVQQFLLTMSAENGETIAQTFIAGMIATLEDGSLIAVVQTLANDGYRTMSDTLSAESGMIIGQNFGQGLANGINSMTDTVHTAAWNLGITAAEALSQAIQEGSPSRVTAESGTNFGLGFINAIRDSMEYASDAAYRMGSGAAGALDRSLTGMAANGMSVPMGRSAYTQQNAASERSAQMYADAIARAMSHVRVVMDGEDVGHLVMPAVSERIAYESDLRRNGTV